MTAVDTNIIVRFLLNDDSEQSPIARDIIRDKSVFISDDVFAETTYILHKRYGNPRPQVGEWLTALAGLENVSVSSVELIKKAFEYYTDTNSLDITDCMLAARHFVDNFDIATFDKALQKKIAAIDEQTQ